MVLGYPQEGLELDLRRYRRGVLVGNNFVSLQQFCLDLCRIFYSLSGMSVDPRWMPEYGKDELLVDKYSNTD